MQLPTKKIEAHITQEGDLNIRIFMEREKLREFAPKFKEKRVYADFLEETK